MHRDDLADYHTQQEGSEGKAYQKESKITGPFYSVTEGGRKEGIPRMRHLNISESGNVDLNVWNCFP